MSIPFHGEFSPSFRQHVDTQVSLVYISKNRFIVYAEGTAVMVRKNASGFLPTFSLKLGQFLKL
jgi:hypothetical protein